MADPLDRLARASFCGIEFPVTHCSVRGAQRRKAHLYPKTPSAKQEKLGRAPYTVHMTAVFDVSLASGLNTNLWPDELRKLLDLLDGGITGQLVTPNRGILFAFCVNYSQEMDARIRSGETVELEFEEDDERGFELKPQRALTANVTTAATRLQASRSSLLSRIGQAVVDALDAVDNAANDLRALRDTGEAYSQLAAAKIERIGNLCTELDRMLSSALTPSDWSLVDALQELWASANDLAKDLASTQKPLAYFTIPRVMTLVEASIAIYGDASRSSELYALNDIDDALALQAGARLVHYAP